MKHYAKLAINKVSGEVEHAATSDATFKENPFEGMEATHTIEDRTFDNLEKDAKFVKARTLLNNIDKRTLKPKEAKNRMLSNMKNEAIQ